MEVFVGLTRDPELRELFVENDIGVVLLPRTVAIAGWHTRERRRLEWGKRGRPRPQLAPDPLKAVRRIEQVVAPWPRWFLDNGAFVAFKEGLRRGTPGVGIQTWTAGLPADALVDFVDACYAVDLLGHMRAQGAAAAPLPEFAVLPDIVGGGAASLALSLDFLARGTTYVPHVTWALVVQEGMTPEMIPWQEPFSVLFVGGKELQWKMQTAREWWIPAAHEHGKRCHIGRVGTAHRVLAAREMGADSIDSALPTFSWEQAERWVRAIRAPVQGRLFNPEDHWYADVR